jgi:putative intracellular protease/amidase
MPVTSVRNLVAVIAVATAASACGTTAPLPPAPVDAAVAEQQKQFFVDAMRPRRPDRPVIVVLALNDATETTDLLLPHAVLERAGVAEVLVVAPRAGDIRLYPALRVQAEMDFAAFDRAHPAGADYVIVPAMEPRNDQGVTAWLRRQAAQGARIVGVCAGALVVAQVGLLDNRRYTSHWFYQGEVSAERPGATYVPHQRYVVDRGVATTTGVTASVPMTIALVEAIAGTERAQALAADLGLSTWTPAHDSNRFGLNARRRWAYIVDSLAFWRRDQRAIDVSDGTDDVALALAADAWSRTRLTRVEAAAPTPTVRLRSGLVLVARDVGPEMRRVALAAGLKPVQQLERTLSEIGHQYGVMRRDRVEQELEYASASMAR